MIHPVQSASPSRAAGIQQGEDEAQRRRWTSYEAVTLGRISTENEQDASARPPARPAVAPASLGGARLSQVGKGGKRARDLSGGSRSAPVVSIRASPGMARFYKRTDPLLQLEYCPN
jgi:hypothetical protein